MNIYINNEKDSQLDKNKENERIHYEYDKDYENRNNSCIFMPILSLTTYGYSLYLLYGLKK